MLKLRLFITDFPYHPPSTPLNFIATNGPIENLIRVNLATCNKLISPAYNIKDIVELNLMGNLLVSERPEYLQMQAIIPSIVRGTMSNSVWHFNNCCLRIQQFETRP